ncbi:MAG: hypothetical protein D6814_17385 [Calditrichaeota bacterium]|nr:MAG: hypothetical protein D6814_17385 [Calditrichota bacterium]
MAKKTKEDEAKEQNSKEKPKSGGLAKTLLMIGIPLMLIQTGLAYFVISRFVQPPPAASKTEAPEEKAEEEEGPVKLYIIKDVIVNPAGTAGARFLNATIALEYSSPDLEQELTDKDVQIRDLLINILASKSIAELDGMDDKEALRQEILEKCNAFLKKGKIKKVYFSNFIMQ